MGSMTSVAKVVLVPRNGYANRLQAWASASALAEAIGASAAIFWEAEHVAAARPEDLFDGAWFEARSMSADELSDLIGGDHTSLPRYLTHDPSRAVISLTGHDRGEQAFMTALMDLARSLSTPHTLVIIAGGKFHVTDELQARSARQVFYRSLQWNSAIDGLVLNMTPRDSHYAALHIRTTDRSIEAPSQRSIRQALEQVRHVFARRSLFVCADSAESRRAWSEEARNLGFEPWTVDDVEYDRSLPANGVSAMVDWRLLAGAEMVIHPSESTFSSEATVAGGSWDQSLPLTAGSWLRSARSFQRFLGNAASFPRRRLQSSR